MAAEPWWLSWDPTVAPYAVLLRLFVDDRISPDELEVVFLRLYKADPTAWSDPIFDVLDRFFAEVDDYCPDPALRDGVHDLDGDELRRRAQIALECLQSIDGK